MRLQCDVNEVVWKLRCVVQGREEDKVTVEVAQATNNPDRNAQKSTAPGHPVSKP